MTTTTFERTPLGTVRHMAGVLVSLMVLGLGALLLLAGQDLGIPALCLGGATLAWTVAGLQDARTLGLLDGVALGELAVPLPLLPERSANPRREIAWLPADVPALVAMPDGGWGLVAHDTAVAAAERVSFNGEWHRVAEPKTVHEANAPVATIARIPRSGDAALVDTGGTTPEGVIGTMIRELAERRSEAPTAARGQTRAAARPTVITMPEESAPVPEESATTPSTSTRTPA